MSSGECPCDQGKKVTHMSCTDPEPENGGAKCDCDDVRIANAIQNVQCDGHNVTIEEDCKNEPCTDSWLIHEGSGSYMHCEPQ